VRFAHTSIRVAIGLACFLASVCFAFGQLSAFVFTFLCIALGFTRARMRQEEIVAADKRMP
jgi:hypothetical protein